MARNEHYEEDDDTFSADAYTVKGWDGIAFYVLGWETEPDEDTEWSGYETRTGLVTVVMTTSTITLTRKTLRRSKGRPTAAYVVSWAVVTMD